MSKSPDRTLPALSRQDQPAIGQGAGHDLPWREERRRGFDAVAFPTDTARALVETNAILRATQEAVADGICLVSDAGLVIDFNRRFARMWEITPELEIELCQQGRLMSHVLARLEDPDEFIEKIGYLFDNPADSSRDEVALLDGRVFERYSSPAISEQGQSFGRVWSFSDLTDRKRYERRLAHQAFHDPLTELPNRALFVDRLTRALTCLGRSRKALAVLFLDLDRFKVINDSLGHDRGDQLLMQVARRLVASLRPSDTAARFGGDEFTIFLEDIETEADATRIAERIAESLQEPFRLQHHDVHTSSSIGIALATSSQQSAEDLLRNADVAMYRAKQKGNAGYEVFDATLNSFAMERLQSEIDLRQAVKRNQMRLHFQPQVHLGNGLIVGFEALLRWEHPERGLVGPNEFVGMAEETGMIVPIGYWALREACSQIHRWNQGGLGREPLEVAVNLSARQFQQADLVAEITRILHETRLAPPCLKLEITESVMMEGAETILLQLQEIKRLGVRLAIDDFGTGYSSLSYLRRFPFDALKVDKSFVARLGQTQDLAIMRAVTSLAQALDMEVTAEGIETPDQLELLRALDCQYGQGFFFARPLPPEEAGALLAKRPRW